jgi:N-acetylglutamate synthase-like GNAT family acetyltransferase
MNIHQIDLLKNHPDVVPALVAIWHEGIGKKWVPDIPLEQVQKRFQEHLNADSLPLTFVAFSESKPVGMCSLRISDGLKGDLSPWLSSLVVVSQYQKQGIGKSLISAVKAKAKELGFNNIYLFTLDPALPQYYKRLGWQEIGTDMFREYEVTTMKSFL